MRKYNQKLLDEQANQVFKVFLEAVLAYDQGQAYSEIDGQIMEAVERFLDETGDIDTFRRKLAAFYFAKEREGGIVRWDSHLAVRNALLLYMDVTLEQYLVAMGLKQHRSIDDPWEPT